VHPCNYPVRKHAHNKRSWRLYRLDLMDVNPIDENQICHRRYAAKRVAAKDDESVIRFRNSGKFREIKWKILKHDRLDEKPLGGWLEFEYVMELAPGTQGNDFMIK